MSPEVEITIEGNAKRESLVATGFVNERHFVLENGIQDHYLYRLCSYRAPTDESPSKTWNITHNTTVSQVTHSDFKLRGEEQVTPLGFLTALAKQDSFQKVQLVRTIKPPFVKHTLTLLLSDIILYIQLISR